MRCDIQKLIKRKTIIDKENMNWPISFILTNDHACFQSYQASGLFSWAATLQKRQEAGRLKENFKNLKFLLLERVRFGSRGNVMVVGSRAK